MPVLNVPTVATMPSIGQNHTDLTFDYTSEFLTISKRAGTHPLDLAASAVTVNGAPIPLSLPAGLDQTLVVQAVMDAVKAQLAHVQAVANVLIRRLGLNIGVADVTATDLMCQPGMPPVSIPPTPGTPPPPPTPGTGPGGLRPVLVG